MSYSLDSAVLEQIVVALRQQHRHPTFANPLKTALRCLRDPAIPWEWKGFVLFVKSKRTDAVYRCMGTACTCAARVTKHTPLGYCWHTVAWHILIAEWAITDPFGLIRR